MTGITTVSRHPGKRCGDSWIHYRFICHEGNSQQLTAGMVVSTLQKISRIRSQSSRIKELDQFKKKVKSNDFINKVIDELGLGAKSSDPASVATNIAKLHSLLQSPEKSLPYAQNLRRKIPDIDSDVIKVPNFSTLSPSSNANAEDVLNKYKDIADNIKEITKRMTIKPVKTQDEYDEVFSDIDSLYRQLKSVVEQAKETKTGILEIDEALTRIAGISREYLPGYKVTKPTDLAAIQAKAKTDPCP